MKNISLYNISKQIIKEGKSIQEIGAYLPCSLHLNNLNNFAIVDFDESLPKNLGMSDREVLDSTSDLMTKTVEPGDLAYAVHEMEHYLRNADSQRNFEFVQRVHFPITDFKETYFTSGMLLRDQLLCVSIPIGSLEIFNKDINNIFEETQFLRNNTKRFSSLSAKEIQIGELMAQGRTTEEVMLKMGITKNTFKKHRTNIYRKIGVKNYFEFYRFAKAFDMDI
ncbi:hypothetical protein FUAX_38250 (plasmid) [Fulvitalea axinellae]|uniref:HTH luxR-type domain-containing protein n=1 Tax=Fulvitalea axinellae TaxID=1182444 RepID=A0AAU9D5V6_9BACT|nr:hypothetical protein FUAX_38250 [Fulvitalea axinellae]